jgi:hypothetical protein
MADAKRIVVLLVLLVLLVSSAGGGCGVSSKHDKKLRGIPDQENIFLVVGPGGSLSFGGELDLYRRKNRRGLPNVG